MTLLSDQEIKILKKHYKLLQKERLVLKRVLHHIAKQYQAQYQLLNNIIQCKEDIDDYKKQYFIITSHNKEIGDHILQEIANTQSQKFQQHNKKQYSQKSYIISKMKTIFGRT